MYVLNSFVERVHRPTYRHTNVDKYMYVDTFPDGDKELMTAKNT